MLVNLWIVIPLCGLQMYSCILMRVTMWCKILVSRGSEKVGSNRGHPFLPFFFFFFFNTVFSMFCKSFLVIFQLCRWGAKSACLDVSTLVSKYHFESHYDDTNPRKNALGPSLFSKMTCSFPWKIVEDLDKENYSLNNTRGLCKQSWQSTYASGLG